MAQIVEVAGLCEVLHCLPSPGGLLDQDPAWVRRLDLYHEIRAKKYDADRNLRDQKVTKPHG